MTQLKRNTARNFAGLAMAFVATLLLSPSARADSTLHIGPGAGTTCATGCAGDPNLLGAGLMADVYQQSGGAPTLAQPVLFIIAVPNDTTNLFTSVPLSGLSATNPYPGGTVTGGTVAFASGGTYGLINPVVDGFFGTLTSGEIYSFLGLGGANNSNNFANLTGADLAIDGITANNFGIYVFALNANLGAQGLLNVSISSSLPTGSFVVAYGEGASGKNGKTKVFDTPFTEAGIKDGHSATPEPASLLLLGSALLSVGGFLRRRMKA